MLEILRRRVKEALKTESSATLSTYGPGGIQVGIFPCEVLDLVLYLLVPASLDVLFNLESETAVVVTTSRWQIEGNARVCPPAQQPPTLKFTRSPQAQGCALVAVTPDRIHLSLADSQGYRETIDLW